MPFLPNCSISDWERSSSSWRQPEDLIETIPKPSNGPLPSFLVNPEIPSPNLGGNNLGEDDDDDGWRKVPVTVEQEVEEDNNVSRDPESLNSSSSSSSTEVLLSLTREEEEKSLFLKQFGARNTLLSSESLGDLGTTIGVVVMTPPATAADLELSVSPDRSSKVAGRRSRLGSSKIGHSASWDDRLAITAASISEALLSDDTRTWIIDSSNPWQTLKRWKIQWNSYLSRWINKQRWWWSISYKNRNGNRTRTTPLSSRRRRILNLTCCSWQRSFSQFHKSGGGKE